MQKERTENSEISGSVWARSIVRNCVQKTVRVFLLLILENLIYVFIDVFRCFDL